MTPLILPQISHNIQCKIVCCRCSHSSISQQILPTHKHILLNILDLVIFIKLKMNTFELFGEI